MTMTKFRSRRLAAASVAAAISASAARRRRRAVRRRRTQAVPGWHVLVYTVNDSSSDLPLGLDIDEMINASRSGVNFSVYIDSSDASAPDFHSQTLPNEGGAVVVEITGGTATVAERRGELDSGSPDTLGWFVATSLIAHPAEKTAFVAWDHGSGWQGIAFDEDVTASGDTAPGLVPRRR